MTGSCQNVQLGFPVRLSELARVGDRHALVVLAVEHE